MQKSYRKIKRKNRKALADFINQNGCRVFSEEDYKNCIEKYGDVVEVDCGDFIPTSKLSEYNACKEMCNKRLMDKINEDKTGEGFILEMCTAELRDRNYELTGDDSIFPELMSDPSYSSRLSHGLELAKKALTW